MSTGTHLLDRIGRFASHIREHFHEHHDKEFIMQFLDDLIAKAQELAKPDAALTARAEQAEAERDALKQQITADEQKAKDALDALNAADPKASTGSTGGQGTSAQPVVGDTSTTLSSTDGTTTTLDHTSQTVTTTDSNGAAVATDQAAAQAVTQAAQAAGKIG